MDTQSFANGAFLLLGIVCTVLAIRSFYVYALSRSDMLFVIGLSMAIIGVAVFYGFIENVHLVTWNTQWAWYIGTIVGAIFLVFSTFARSLAQLRLMRYAEIVGALLFCLIMIITPLFSPFGTIIIPVSLNILRTAIYVVGFANYAYLYGTKRTRFSFMMCLAFLLIGFGFLILTPQIFNPGLAVLSIVGPSMRIIGYTTLLIAYSVD